MTRHILSACLMALLGATFAPSTAFAQPTAQPPLMQVQEIESGFVIAPEARFTTLNDRASTLAGVSGGWLTDRTLFIGAAGYWNTNRDDDHRMQYGGAVARWNLWPRQRVSLSTGGLVGVGTATLSRTVGDLFGGPIAGGGFRNARLIPADARFRVNDTFFIAEPQVSALVHLNRWLRLDAGVGYRLIGSSPILGDQLRGVSGTIALQFGGR